MMKSWYSAGTDIFDNYYYELGDGVITIKETAYYVKDIGMVKANDKVEIVYNNQDQLWGLYGTTYESNYELTNYSFGLENGVQENNSWFLGIHQSQ